MLTNTATTTSILATAYNALIMSWVMSTVFALNGALMYCLFIPIRKIIAHYKRPTAKVMTVDAIIKK